MGALIPFLALITALAQGVTSQSAEVTCVLPEGIEGSWMSTLFGTFSFSNESFTSPFELGGRGVKEMKCYKSNDAGDYVFRSVNTFEHFELPFHLFTCINLAKVTNDSYHITVKTARSSTDNNEPVGIRSASVNKNDFVDKFCSKEQSDWIEGDMVRQGNVEAARQKCPTTLDGKYNVTFDKDHGYELCKPGAEISSCSSPQSYIFDYTHCNAQNLSSEYDFFKVPTTYECMGTRNNKTLIFVNGTLSANNFIPFSCMEIAEGTDNSTFNLTQTAGGCGGSWNKTTASPALMLSTLIKRASCYVAPPPTPPPPPPANTNVDTSNATVSNSSMSNMTSPSNYTGNSTQDSSNATDADTGDNGYNGTDAFGAGNTTDNDTSTETNGSNGTSNSSATGPTDGVPPMVSNSFMVISIATALAVLVCHGYGG